MILELFAMTLLGAIVSSERKPRVGHGLKTPEGDENWDYCYHSTSKDRLAQVAMLGLEPFDPEAIDSWDEDLEQPVGVYFAPVPRLALHWNEVLLRFPWPEDYDEDPASEGRFIRGEVLRSAYYTTDPVKPEEIEVWSSEGWVPISRFASHSP